MSLKIRMCQLKKKTQEIGTVCLGLIYWITTRLTVGNLKIRSCLIYQVTGRSKSGSFMIDQAAARPKSGGYLVDQAATKVNSGGCLVNRAAARLKSGSCPQHSWRRDTHGNAPYVHGN